MSRKVTATAVAAFLANRSKVVGNTHTDGNALFLHGNRIAEHHGVERPAIRITLAGWNTPTTRERLNGLPGVRVSTSKGQAYLNGEPWDGSWSTITL